MRAVLFRSATLAVLAPLFYAAPAAARPWRVLQVPNGSVAQCLTCHVYPGGPRNDFGNTIENYGGVGFLENSDVQWGKAVADPAHPSDPPKTLAELDSDRDGRTNGAELLDPLGVWRTGQPDPGNPAFVRLPGRPDAPVVIRQVHVTGGVAGASYQQDFIELFNRSDTPRSLAGWSLQFAPATGVTNFAVGPTTITELPAVTLAPGQSFLIQEASGGSGGVTLPAPDLADPTPIALGDTGGKLALVGTTTPLACNGSPNPCSDAALALILDLVGYGNTLFYEGAAAPTPSGAQALARARNGCTDINNNGPNAPVPADFALAPPVARNSSSPVMLCAASAPPAPAVPAFGSWELATLALLLVLLGARPRPA